jgi:hypothetical protein
MKRNDSSPLMVLLLWGISINGIIGLYSSAKAVNNITNDNLEFSKQLWEINRISEPSDSAIKALESYLRDGNSKLKIAAIRQLAIIDAKKSLAFLKNIDDYRIKPTADVAIAFLESNNTDELITKLDKTNESLLSNPLMLDKVGDDINFILSERKICGGIFTRFCRSSLTNIGEFSQSMRMLSARERNDSVINTIVNFNNPMEYETAIYFGADSIGTEIIPQVLQELSKLDRIPLNSPPPYSREHTVFILLLTVLKSIPDSSSIPMSEKLSKDENSFVAESSKEALRWVKSSIPYPYKYHRLLNRVDENQ